MAPDVSGVTIRAGILVLNAGGLAIVRSVVVMGRLHVGVVMVPAVKHAPTAIRTVLGSAVIAAAMG